MILHLYAAFYIADQPQDQPISTRGCRMNQAEPEEIAITQYDAKNVCEDAKNKPRHEGSNSIGVYFYRHFQMGVGRKSFPLKTEFDRGELFVSKDHPDDSMDQFMHNYA